MPKRIIVYLDNDKEGTEKKKKPAEKIDVGHTEYYQSMQANMLPDLKIKMRYGNYEKQLYLWYKEQRYKIHRTYSNDDGWIELTARRF